MDSGKIDDIVEVIHLLPDDELEELYQQMRLLIHARRGKNTKRVIHSLQAGDKVRMIRTQGALQKGNLGEVVKVSRTRVRVNFDNRMWSAPAYVLEKVEA